MDMLAAMIDLKGALAVAAIFILFEWLVPARPDQRRLRRGWVTDSVYFLVNRIPIGFGLLAIALAAGAAGNAFVPASLRDMVGAQPIWAQTLALILVGDLCFYAMHRLFHSVPFLWRFHAVHHSIQELDWLAAHRVHPIDQILTKGASLIPCFALGFSGEAIALFFLIYQWHSLTLHANVGIGLGPLHWLIASPRFHHWHHADHPEAWNKNFAGQLPLWDLLFGTAHMRRDAMPARYGIEDDLPASYQRQLLYPFHRPADREPG